MPGFRKSRLTTGRIFPEILPTSRARNLLSVHNELSTFARGSSSRPPFPKRCEVYHLLSPFLTSVKKTYDSENIGPRHLVCPFFDQSQPFRKAVRFPARDSRKFLRPISYFSIFSLIGCVRHRGEWPEGTAVAGFARTCAIICALPRSIVLFPLPRREITRYFI